MSDDFREQLFGKRLTTASVLYYMPDHPSLLQEFLWQTQDIAPDFPRVRRFLEHWRREIEAVIHSVRVSCVGEIRAAEIRLAEEAGRLH